jgi:phosphoglucosamine mutase
MQAKKKRLAELSKDCVIYPQVLKNVRVQDKKKALENSELKALINELETSLKGDGRILVRPSGTEPLVRVMVEASTLELCQELVDTMVTKIEELKL